MESSTMALPSRDQRAPVERLRRLVAALEAELEQDHDSRVTEAIVVARDRLVFAVAYSMHTRNRTTSSHSSGSYRTRGKAVL